MISDSQQEGKRMLASWVKQWPVHLLIPHQLSGDSCHDNVGWINSLCFFLFVAFFTLADGGMITAIINFKGEDKLLQTGTES